MVERAILGNRRSPYRQLLQAAGCQRGDLEALVRREGVDGALGKLFEAGVYVSFEEFKGLAPAVRGSQRFNFAEADFDNPLIAGQVFSQTGGSRGRPARIKLDLDLLAQTAPHWAVWFAAHGVLAEPLVFVQPFYPAAIAHQLICARFGDRFAAWFSTGGGGSPLYRLTAAYTVGLVRLAAGFPRRVPVEPDRLERVGSYLAELTGQGRRPAVNTSPSMAARICLAMRERGGGLAGVTFLLGAEPLTAARKATIESSGARATVTYGFSEASNVGSQCSQPDQVDEIHVSLDVFAALRRPRPTDDGGSVDALLLTTFRPASPKVLLNVEIGDYASLETKRHGCGFEELGYVQRLHTIRSFGKLTGDGVTFFDADILHLLETVLPARWGGSLADYQLVEQQTAAGLPRYALLVSPDLGELDEPALVAFFLDELGKLKRPYRFMANQWAATGAVRVERRRPEAGARGKVPPFCTLSAP
jgi:hypothetical protein